MAKSNTDNKTLELIKAVNKKKAEIAKAERPNWITNCSFSYTENPAQAVNIHVENNVRNLICYVAFLRDREKSYQEAADLLEIDAPAFTWQGFKVEDWIKDIKARISKIQITTEKKKLELLEERLGRIISPELRAQMELEAIESELL